GGFEQFSYNESTTVKVITVSPGHRLSLQAHARRAELWQVLDGPLEVTVGDETWTAATDERVWVPLGARHRMHNRGERPARVLELPWGDYDEADSVRIEDDSDREDSGPGGRNPAANVGWPG